jgi:hypothetical protein
VVGLDAVRVGSFDIDAAIQSYVRREYGIAVGERTAEEIKVAIGSAWPVRDELKAEVRGRDLASGLPKTVILTPAEIRAAIDDVIVEIVESVIACLGSAPPELAHDLISQGMVLVGGGGMLAGLDQRIAHETEIDVHLVENALESVVLGAGRCIEDPRRPAGGVPGQPLTTHVWGRIAGSTSVVAVSATALIADARRALLDDRRQLTLDELAALAAVPDDDVPALADAAHAVRVAWCGDMVEIEGILSAKTGGCPEDCQFCSQSSRYDTPVKAVPLLSHDEVLAAARETRRWGRASSAWSTPCGGRTSGSWPTSRRWCRWSGGRPACRWR